MAKVFKSRYLSLLAFLMIAATPAWNPAPWLADLDQMQSAINQEYPNLDWLTREREVSLDKWFARTAAEIRQSHDDADARRAMDKLVERFNDGHLELQWPESNVSKSLDSNSVMAPRSVMTTPAEFCASKRYDASRISVGTAAALPGYRPVNDNSPFVAGLVTAHGTTVGIIRLGIFSPEGYPSICERAVAITRTAIQEPCDDACTDRITTEAYALMTRDLISSVDELRRKKAKVLLVDLTHNGGGTEWAEAAARIVSPVVLRSARIGVLRSEAWATRWKSLASKLTTEAVRAPAADQSMLTELARSAGAVADQLKPCQNESCSRLGQAGFASGLVASSPSGLLNNKNWGPDVFSPAQYPYRDSVWKRPVIILVDSETWSAAEQFAALMQDNRAAIIMGGRTGGAGCGHLYSNDPITLHYSGAKLKMPNCVRFRRDGSNEVGGVVPDVSTGVRWNDGAAYAGRLTAAQLPAAIMKARTLAIPDRQRRIPTSISASRQRRFPKKDR